MSSLEHLVTRMSTPFHPPLPIMQYPFNNIPYPHGFGYQSVPFHLLQPPAQVQNPFQRRFHTITDLCHLPSLIILDTWLITYRDRVWELPQSYPTELIKKGRHNSDLTNSKELEGYRDLHLYIPLKPLSLITAQNTPAHHGESKRQPLPHSMKTPNQHLEEPTSAPSPVCTSPASRPSALPAPSTKRVKTIILYYII